MCHKINVLFYFNSAKMTSQQNNPAIKHFHQSCNSTARACKIVAAFILFYCKFSVRTCAINAAIYFIAAFMLFYCTSSHGLR